MDDRNLDGLLVELAKQGDKSAFDSLVLKHQKRLMRDIYAFSEHLRKDHHATQDVLQETFRKAWRVLHTFQGGDVPVYYWLRQIGINAALDYFRQRKIPVFWDPPTNDAVREEQNKSLRLHPLAPITVPEFFSEGRRAPKTNDVEHSSVEGLRAPYRQGLQPPITWRNLGGSNERKAAMDSEETEDCEDSPESTLSAQERIAILDRAVRHRQMPERWHKAMTLLIEGLSYQEIATRMNLTKASVRSTLTRARKALGALILDHKSDVPIGAYMRLHQNKNLVSRIYDRYRPGTQTKKNKR